MTKLSLTVLLLFVAISFMACGSGDGGNGGGNQGQAVTARSSTTVRVSIKSDGSQVTTENSFRPSISATGRYIAFDSRASDLVAGDTNGLNDIFVHDRDTDGDGTFDEFGFVSTDRVSINSGGNQSITNGSISPSINSDGSLISFESRASDLVAGDTNSFRDIFVRDRNTNTTSRVSVSSSAAQSDNNSFAPDISGDGRYVAFESNATNLVIGDTNGLRDIFVHDRNTGTTMRVSVTSGGSQVTTNNNFAPSISSDGRFVAFESDASELVSGDTNGLRDIFVHDRNTGTTVRVSVNSGGSQVTTNNSFAPSISEDGRYVAFESDASDLVSGDTNGLRDIFVHDRNTGTTVRVSVKSGGSQVTTNNSFAPDISSDGRYVTFQSMASDLIINDTNGLSDIFVHDRDIDDDGIFDEPAATETVRVSVDINGSQINTNESFLPVISDDAKYVAFESPASDFVPGDTNGLSDIFVRGPQ